MNGHLICCRVANVNCTARDEEGTKTKSVKYFSQFAVLDASRIPFNKLGICKEIAFLLKEQINVAHSNK